MDFTILADPKVKIKEREKMEKYMYLAWEQKKMMNVMVMAVAIVIVALGTSPKGLEKKTGGTRNQKNWDHLDYCIMKIG